MLSCQLLKTFKKFLDNVESTGGVFINLGKSFDAGDHGILLQKLEDYGIRGIAFSTHL